jgi:hypothetical protein
MVVYGCMLETAVLGSTRRPFESATEGDNYVMRYLHAIYSLQNCMGMQSAGMCSELCHESGSVRFEIHVTSLCGRGEGVYGGAGFPAATSSRSNSGVDKQTSVGNV